MRLGVILLAFSLLLAGCSGGGSDLTPTPTPPNETATATPTVSPTPSLTPTPTATATSSPSATPTSTPTPTPTPEPSFDEDDFEATLEENDVDYRSLERNDTGYVLIYSRAFGTDSNFTRELDIIKGAWLQFQADANETGDGLYIVKVTDRRKKYRDVEVLEGTPIRKAMIKTEWANAYLAEYSTEEEYDEKVNGTIRILQPPDYREWLDDRSKVTENETRYLVELTVENEGEASLDVEFRMNILYVDENGVVKEWSTATEWSGTLEPGDSVTLRKSVSRETVEDQNWEGINGAEPGGVDAVLS